MEKQNSDVAKEEDDISRDLGATPKEEAQEERDIQQSISSMLTETQANLEPNETEQELRSEIKQNHLQRAYIAMVHDEFPPRKGGFIDQAEVEADAIEQEERNHVLTIQARFFRSQPALKELYESLEEQAKKLPKEMKELQGYIRNVREEVLRTARKDRRIAFQDKLREYRRLVSREFGDKEPSKRLDNFLELKTFYEDDMRPFLDEWATDRLNTIIEGLVSAWSTNQSLREQIVRKLGPDGLSHMDNMERSDSREGQYRRNILALHLAGKKQDEIRKATGHRSQSKISTDLSKVKELMTAYFARDKAMLSSRDVDLASSSQLESIEGPFSREDFTLPKADYRSFPSEQDFAKAGIVPRLADDDNGSSFGFWTSSESRKQTGRIKAFLHQSTLSSLQIVRWTRHEDSPPKEALLSVHFIDYLWDKKTENELNAMRHAISRIPTELQILEWINPDLRRLPHICVIATSPVTNDWYSDSYLYIEPDLMHLRSALSHPTSDGTMGFGTKLSDIVPESTGERVLNWLYSNEE